MLIRIRIRIKSMRIHNPDLGAPMDARLYLKASIVGRHLDATRRPPHWPPVRPDVGRTA
jgi:hypothetical protein